MNEANKTASQVGYEKAVAEMARERFWKHPDCAAEVIAKHYCQNAMIALELAQVLKKHEQCPEVDVSGFIQMLVDSISQNHLNDFGAPNLRGAGMEEWIMNKYALNDHSVTCPACLAEYSKLDSPAEYERVKKRLILDAVFTPLDPKSNLARLSAEILAAGKLPSMTPEEEGELRANMEPCIEFKDLSHAEQAMVRQYLPTRTPILEQVCLGLQELGVDCAVGTTVIICPLVDGNDWRFGRFAEHEDATWEGLFVKPAVTDSWVSDVPVTCRDVPRITQAIFNWIKRFDYREYRGPAK